MAIENQNKLIMTISLVRVYTQKTKGAFEGAEGVIEAFSSLSYQESYLD